MAPLPVYLAGPDVFFEDALERAEQARVITRRFGFVPMLPLDNELPTLDDPASMSRWIYEKNLELIEKAALVIANLSPFRGPSADPGTVWEIGFACGRGLPVWGFSEASGDYRSRVEDDGMMVEDFGGYDNLMITESVKAPLHGTLEEALAAAARHFGIESP